MQKRIWQVVFSFILLVSLVACNLPAGDDGAPSSATTVEQKITNAWEGCVKNTGVFTHVCIYTSLSSFAEATDVQPGFTIPAGTLVLVNERDAFVVNGNQSGVEGSDYLRIAGAQTGLSSTYLTLRDVVMRSSGKQIALQGANPSSLFPGWGVWPPVLPTQFVIQTPGPVQPSATPNIIPPPFTSADFLNLWYSMTPETNITMLLDEAYEKWGMYGGEFTSITYSYVRAGSIIWSVDLSNLVKLDKQPYDPYDPCIGIFNESLNVIYVTCDSLVVNPPFKYLYVQDWQNFPQGSIPALPANIHP